MKRKSKKGKESKKGNMTITSLEILKSIRKPMPKPTIVITPKKYDRKDKKWMEGNE